MRTFPVTAATCNAVAPLSAVLLGSAPCSSSNLMTSVAVPAWDAAAWPNHHFEGQLSFGLPWISFNCANTYTIYLHTYTCNTYTWAHDCQDTCKPWQIHSNGTSAWTRHLLHAKVSHALAPLVPIHHAFAVVVSLTRCHREMPQSEGCRR